MKLLPNNATICSVCKHRDEKYIKLINRPIAGCPNWIFGKSPIYGIAICYNWELKQEKDEDITQ